VEETELRHSEQTLLWISVTGRNDSLPTLPPVVVDSASSSSFIFRLATIVLGVLLGIVLLVLVIFVICSVCGGSKTKTNQTSSFPSAFKPALDFR
jgi:hypothetical protein